MSRWTWAWGGFGLAHFVMAISVRFGWLNEPVGTFYDYLIVGMLCLILIALEKK